MAYLEPRALLHDVPRPDDFVPVWSREDPRETKELADLWDSLGSLVVRPATLGFSDSFKLARAFNCYKAPNRDRMIIDRRGQNWAESRLSGPSMLEVCPKRQTVLCAAADRKDFYHQIHAPLPKALCDALGPALASIKHTPSGL